MNGQHCRRTLVLQNLLLPLRSFSKDQQGEEYVCQCHRSVHCMSFCNTHKNQSYILHTKCTFVIAWPWNKAWPSRWIIRLLKFYSSAIMGWVKFKFLRSKESGSVISYSLYSLYHENEAKCFKCNNLYFPILPWPFQQIGFFFLNLKTIPILLL